MTFGMMTRVFLGRTGGPLVASGPTSLGFAAILLAGAARALAPAFARVLHDDMILVAGLAWVAAFLTVVATILPALTRLRPDVRPG
jgi:uncharacterized protein involved in response to NO